MTHVPAASSPQTCPDCGRDLPQNKGCLHCAIEQALDAATECPQAEADLLDSANLLAKQGGFAAFADPVLPMQVGRFRLLKRLGIGGMGAVYEAVDGALDRIVALKMIRGFHFSTVDEMSRFQREAQAAARLDHPNIVPVYEIGEVDGCPFISMKIIRGGTLADRLKAGGLTAEESATIMAKVAAAVGYAHEKGILHRDLKPSNILMDEEGEPWLTDFGMARLSGTEVALTVTGAQIGTPHYMSPEQAAGLVRALTPASDVWGLGAIFYQMLSGQLPYEGESNVAIMHQVLSADPPQLQAKSRREMELSVLIERCLQKEPIMRMQSATMLAEELERWLKHRPILSRPVSRWEKSLRWSKQHRWSLVSWFVALMGVALAIREFLPAPRSRPAHTVAEIIISREGSRLVLRDLAGGDQLLYIGEKEPGTIHFREEGRHFQMPDGSMILGATAGISLDGITQILVDGGAGQDNINVVGMGTPLPDLQINGGEGDDLIQFWKPISFKINAGLDVDLQDDAAAPGVDGVRFQEGAVVKTSGTGKITVRCSSGLFVGKAELRTVDGGITLEANQQAIPTVAEFKGIELDMARVISDGIGPINMSGRGGTRGIFQFGISLTNQVLIQGGTEGAVTLRGQGGAGNGQNDNTGINIVEERCMITSKRADILLEGRGEGSPDTGSNNGIAIVAGTIQGNGKVTLEGKGGETKGGANHGILLRGPVVAIRSSGGDIFLKGQGGGTSNSHATNNCGVFVSYNASVQADGSDNIILEGRGGLGGGTDQAGVLVYDGAKIDAAAGSIKITGHSGNDSSLSVGVFNPGRVRTSGPQPRVAIEGERQEIDEAALQVK